MKFCLKKTLHLFILYFLIQPFLNFACSSFIEEQESKQYTSTQNNFTDIKSLEPTEDTPLSLILSVRSPTKALLHQMLSDVRPEKLLLLAGSKFFTEEERKSLLPYFKTILRIENYRDSGALEIEAYKLYQQKPFQNIIAYHEYDLLRAAQLRDFFGLKGQSYQSALIFREKILMKELLLKAGIKVPAFSRINSPVDLLNFTQKNGFPVIIKPILGTGSSGVSKINNFTEMETFIKKSKNFNDDYRTDLEVESFVEGITYHVEGFIQEGKILASWPSICINHAISLMEGKYVAHHHLSTHNPMVKRLNNYAQSVLEALPTPSNTAFLLELFHQEKTDELIFCEVAARVGGGVKEMWIEDFNIDIEAEFIRIQAGLPLCKDLVHFFKSVESLSSPKALSGWILFPKLTGTLKNIPKEVPFSWVKQYSLKVQSGNIIAPTTNVSDSLASAFITSTSEDQFKEHVVQLAQWFSQALEWEEASCCISACKACASCELCINWVGEEPRNCFSECPSCKSFLAIH